MKTTTAELHDVFADVLRSLRRETWFARSRWQHSIHDYPEKRPQGVTLQIFRPHWFNEDGQGIHVETYLDLNPAKRRRAYVALHLLHRPLFPGTRIKRMALTKPFIDEVLGTVREWKGYRLRAGKYGSQPFSRELDGTALDFAPTVATEISRIIRLLEPALERALRGAIGSR